MAMLPFAFSVHNFISSIGADAGFAAIIGLAVLILLYFAHARETANLREDAALLTQRLQQAELRVVQLSRSQEAPAAPAVVPPPAAMMQPALAPCAPAGTGAPALAAATRVVPLVHPQDDSDVEGSEPEPVAAPAAAMAMAGVAAGAVASSAPAAAPTPPAAPAPAPAAAAAPLPVPAPAPAAPPPARTGPAEPAAPVSPLPGLAVPAPATNAGGNGATHQPGPPPARPTEPGWSGPISASRGGSAAVRKPAQLPPLQPPPRRRRLGRGVAIAIVALAAVALAVVVFALTSVGSSKHTPGTSTSNAPGASQPTTTAAFKPSAVTVAVLNGTSTNQLAHRIGDKLVALGYKEGTLATAASQTQQTTVVAYAAGANRHARAANHTAALHVARALGLHRSAVKPVNQSTLQVACPASTSCTANVVVTVGADLANS